MKIRVRKLVARAKQEMIKELLYSLSASSPRKILFDHLPKCGGSSLSVYLQAHYPRRKTFSTNGSKSAASVDYFKNLSYFKNLPQRKRNGYDLVKGHFANELIDYAHPECLKVTVLREPVDRIVSHYYYAKRRPEHYLYSKIHSSELSLEDYVTSNLSGELRNWYTTHFSGLTADEAERTPEEAITKAVDFVLNRYDIIGFLDNYSLFFETLRYKANLRYEYQNKKVRVTQDRPSLNDVAQSTIIKIQQVNCLDIAFYKKIRDAIG